MGTYREIEGDLIVLAKKGEFDVIAHGCNCQCIMGAGIAPQMADHFGADFFDRMYEANLEEFCFGDYQRINKLGNINYFNPHLEWDNDKAENLPENLIVVNAYTQLDIMGRRIGQIDLDYEALALCLRKMNVVFKGKKIGLPQIGCGLAGGDWKIVKSLIIKELCDCEVTIVIFKE